MKKLMIFIFSVIILTGCFSNYNVLNTSDDNIVAIVISSGTKNEKLKEVCFKEVVNNNGSCKFFKSKKDFEESNKHFEKITIIGGIAYTEAELLGSNLIIKPEYENDKEPEKFNMGEIIEISTDEGEFLFVINSARLVEDLPSEIDNNPKHVIIIEYYYENLSYNDGFLLSEKDFVANDIYSRLLNNYAEIDYLIPEKIEVGKGFTAEMVWSLDTEETKFTLGYKKQEISDNVDAIIEIEIEE